MEVSNIAPGASDSNVDSASRSYERGKERKDGDRDQVVEFHVLRLFRVFVRAPISRGPKCVCKIEMRS